MPSRACTFYLLLSLLATPALFAQQTERDLLARMTLEEKFWQLFMIPGDRSNPEHDYSHGIFGLQVSPAATARADAERIRGVQRYFTDSTRLGIPIIPFEEAVHGLKRPGATMFPQAIALAATWDTAIVGRVAAAIARESRSRGIRQVLAPVVNVATDVRWGRVEETYGEDPWLSAAMARAYVAPFTRHGVITTPKHFVANVGDGGRDSYPVTLDERTLDETHFPPFRAAFDAGARSVMTSYNSVNGVPTTQSPWLLTEILRRRWGFPGFVISDMAATGGATVLHLTEPSTPVAAQHAFEAGLDVVFQSAWSEHRPYLEAFRRGLIFPATMDSAVARVLRAKIDLGLFGRPRSDPDSAAYWNGHSDHLALAREAAAASLVLLKNDGNVLPLNSARGTIALIGVDAVEARLGGYSSTGVKPISILEGLRARMGARVTYSPGPGRSYREHTVVPLGRLVLKTEMFNGIAFQGAPAAVRRDSVIDAHWTFAPPAPGLATGMYSVRWSGTLTVGPDTVNRLGVEGTDGWRLYLDDELVLERWPKVSAGAHLGRVMLEPGSRHDIRLEYYETTGNAQVRLVWDAGVPGDAQEKIDSAVALAARSGVAIVVAGIEEGEFQDRAYLGLPGRQEALIRAVAATGTPTIVVLVGGSAITMPWLNDVRGVLLAWYPGEQGGHAVADVLLGDINPSGRLPITFPITEGQLPLVYNHPPTGRGDDYRDLTGQPLFPFGFGMSYTSFEYSNLRIERDRGSDSVTVRVRIRNTGTLPGHEVVQVYTRQTMDSVVRPVIQLAAVVRVRMLPGDSRDAVLRLVPGNSISVGGSSRDIRLRMDL